MAIYEPLTDQDAMRVIRTASVEDAGKRRAYGEVMVDYIEGRMIPHVESELAKRFPTAQNQNDPIQPVAFPLVERYLAEAASAYNRPVERTLVDDDGEESDATREVTELVNEQLREIMYDDTMHLNDQMSIANDTSCVWYQAKRGMLRPVVVFPHNIFPACGDQAKFVDETDPDDFAGFVVEVFGGGDISSTLKRYAFLTNAETWFFEGQEPNRPGAFLDGSPHENPFERMQTIEDDAGGLSEKEAPMRMLTFWNRRKRVCGLLPRGGSDIVALNQEINVQWSVLCDILRWQSYAQPVISAINTNDMRHKRKWGMRNPIVLKAAEEQFSMETAAIDYAGIVGVLQQMVQLFAITKRMSPADFAISGVTTASGFAKLVDSLPKLEAREERLRRLVHMEQSVAWPRICAIMVHLGLLPESAKTLKMRVRFADVDFPMSEDEQTKSLERRIKHNLTTPAQELARDEGITDEEAQEKIDANAEANKGLMSPQQATQPGLASAGGAAGILGRLVSRPNRGERQQDQG